MSANLDKKEPIKASLLDQFGEDLWLSRRLQCNDIIKFLMANKAEDEGQKLVVFIKFLEAECSGANFVSDKQWSELLNLMQISRKLNHRTVRLKDIIRNQQIIEENKRLIKQFNLVANASKTIESSLEQLESLMQTGSLEIDLDDDDLLMAQLLQTKVYLESRCWPLLSIIKLELSDDLITSSNSTSKQVDVWCQKVEKHEQVVVFLIRFISDIVKFESKLSQLKPMLSDTEKSQNKSQKSELVEKIKMCRQLFFNAHQFHLSLFRNIQNLKTGVHKKILLYKLANPVNPVMKDKEKLKQSIQDLDDCQMALDEVMRTLRLEFGRFYFVSDLELLTIITLDWRLIIENKSAQNRQIISKLFNNSIESFVVTHNNEQILTQVKTPFGELVTLKGEPVVIRKKMNVYSLEIVRIFNEMLRRLRQTLRLLLFEQLSSNQDQNFIDKSLPVQLMNLVEQVRFCNRVEEAIKKDTTNELIQFYNSRFDSLKASEEQLGNVNWLDNFKSSALISMTVHFLTQLTKLKQVKSIDDWRWIKQVRYYHLLDYQTSEEDLEVRICGVKFRYKFDFLALQTNNQQHQVNFKRLINTELNERSFLVASIAVGNFRLGACPYGPAGSGKTETIKALGHLLGCQVVVHNCDESNESESLDRLIWGLAHAGLWGCFDEFNRLNSSTLSSVSSTLELVQASIRENRLNTKLPDGSIMCIDQASAFFVTLNPTNDNSKYRGRRRLPANMRHLFMPVAMIRVEIESIVSELLLAMSDQIGGPEESMELGQKLAEWLNWMRSNLNSCQGRVEWDLRLVMAILKRLKIAKNPSYPSTMGLLAQSVSCEVACRLSTGELNQFQQTLEEHFNVKLQPPRGAKERFQFKVIELEEQLETRAGVILLGPPASGKSFTWRQLASKKAKQIKWFALNPRACDRNQLFGYVDFGTKKWIDGQLTARVREASKLLQTSTTINQIWIILDGPIDPDWIESLNSVLDDNQVLTLSSGERLDFLINTNYQQQKSIKLIFETSEISNASPATISRLGLVYHEGVNLNFDSEYQTIKRLETVNQFIDTSQSDRLCALIGDLNWNDRVRIFTNCGGIIYNCGEFSTSNHLVELVERFPQTKLFILNDIHLIKSQDGWEAIDFLELLRFMITYRGYYSVDAEHRFISLELKFIITSDSMDLVDERLRSKITSQILLEEESSPDDLELEYANLNEYLLLPEPISCLTLETIEPNQRENITSSLMQQNGDWEVLSFGSSSLLKQSLDTLKEILEDDTKRKKKLFILEDFEYRLMDPKSKSDLFHWLNFLQIKKPKTIKFLYLVSKSESKYTFWRSICGVYKLKSPSLCKLDVHYNNFYEKINSRWRYHSNWLAQKVSKYTKDYQVDLSDRQKTESFNELVLELIEKSTLSLETEQKTLCSGLDRLNEFEQTIEQIRRRCRLQEDELTGKKERIGKMMRSIDVALNGSQQQKEQINQLKEEQQSKTREIERKSLRVEEEFSQVLKLVELSKADVAKHLKPEALNEVKALRSPPKTIKDILDVLFVFLNLADSNSNNNWAAMKSQLAKISLKDELNNYDFKRNLNENLLKQVKEMMASGERASSFTDLQASRASKAVVPILSWIRAALEFGQVLIQLRPLREEMDSLQGESKDLDQKARELEEQLVAVEENIGKDSGKLAQLKEEFEESKVKLETIKKQLEEAIKTRSDLGGQVERWRMKLEKINLNLSSESDLVKVCLAAATLSYYNHQLASVEPLLNLFDLSHLRSNEFVELVTNLLPTSAEETVSTKSNHAIKADEIGKLFHLMVMRICLIANSTMVPFLNIDTINGLRLAEPQLVQYLSSNEIISQDEKMIAIVRPPREESSQEMGEWCQLIELQFRLNKLVVLDLQGDYSHLLSLDLDISNLIVRSSSTTLATREDLVLASGRRNRMVLVGQLKHHRELGRFVRPLDLIPAASCSMASCLSTILNKLIHHHDSNLSKTLEKLEQELQAKQRQSQSMEVRLLRRLSALKHSSLESNDGGLPDDLVKVLSELHRMNLQLKDDLVNLNGKLEESQRKREKYSSLAQEAAQFYLDNLADLDRIDGFYHVSLERYIHLILKTKTIDYNLIVEKVMRPLRPEDRLRFREKLLSSNTKSLSIKNGCVDSLGRVIEELLEEMEETKVNEPKLMLVLHETTKSSPQLELEEILKCHGKRLCYSKTYGTMSDSGKRLEISLKKLLSNNNSEPVKVACLCIANAHLSSRWINGRLIELLKSSRAQAKVLVILVGESKSGSAQETSGCKTITTSQTTNEFDQELIDHAHVRYWHDELALNLSTRFNLFQSTLPALNGPTGLLEKKLILFHVVCQELTKVRETNNLAENRHCCWLKSYTFDYDQLLLAHKSLAGLREWWQDRSEEQLAFLICRYLDSIIYGPRMETLEDERLLSKLARHFIICNSNSSASIDLLLAQVEKGGDESVTFDCVSMLIIDNDRVDLALQ